MNDLIQNTMAMLIIGGMVIAFVAWFIRLEAEVKFLKKEQADQKDHANNSDKAMWSKIEALQSSLTQISLSLGRIEGRLEIKKE